ncbi:hypothetical protein ACN469_40260 [Corallococcus terminator]
MRLLPFLLLALAATPALAQRGAVPSGCQEDYATCKEDCSIEYGGSGRTVKKLTQCLSICTENRGDCSERHSSLRGMPDSVVADPPSRRRTTPRQPMSREEDPFGDSGDSEPRRTSNREEDPFGDARPERDSVRARREAYRPDTVPAEDSRPPAEEVPSAGPAPVDTTPVPAVSRQGVYRASDSEPKPAKPEPKPAPETEPDLGDLEPLDAPSPAPTAAAKPSPRMEPVRPAPAKPTPTVAAADDDTKDPLLDEPPPAPVAATKKPAPPPPSNPLRPTIPAEPKNKDISEWDPNGD